MLLNAKNVDFMCYNFSAGAEDLHGFLWTSSENCTQVSHTTVNCVTTAANVAEIRR